MPSIAKVNRQIAAYPDRYIFWTRKEIRYLPNILENGEVIKAITSGIMNNATWLAVCTQQRLIFLNRGFLYGIEQMQIPLERIQAIDNEFSLFFGNITVWDGASAFTIANVLKRSILPFVKVTQEQMYISRHGAKTATSTGTDVVTQLEKLAELREKGHLTDEEFQTQKKRLLG